ncbi:MAG TPA: class I SAM-dependent methyltransferase [Blastocatellia bacterium]|jgi:SAM-dependent methyltransferase
MSAQFWDTVASRFDDEIFNTLSNDRSRTILRHIDRFSSADSTVCDFGCGVGRYLPLLAERFKAVCAVDISRKCLQVAERNCSALENVTFRRVDLSTNHSELDKFDFAISINALLEPSLRKRRYALETIFQHLSPGGHLLIVVPSLESALFATARLFEWRERTSNGKKNGFAIKFGPKDSRGVDIARGVLNLDGLLEKHYLKEELLVALNDVGFEVDHLEKVEYAWSAMFDKPPRWMKEPYPWDWLATCGKKLQ